MSDTPRTDKALNLHYDEGDYFGEETTKDAYEFARELERENAELRKDKERLDWLLTTQSFMAMHLLRTREAIDKAMQQNGSSPNDIDNGSKLDILAKKVMAAGLDNADYIGHDQ